MRSLLNNYLVATKIDEMEYKQKSKVLWLKEGGNNTSFFFKTLMNRRNRKKIFSIRRSNGVLVEGEVAVQNEACNYFSSLLNHGSPNISNSDMEFLLRDLTDVVHGKVTK